MIDKTETLDGALLQHGKFNNRVYLMRLGNANVKKLIKYMDTLAKENSYAKIFIKVPEWVHNKFSNAGYCTEAKVRKFFSGEVAALFMCKYFDKDIEKNKFQHLEQIQEIIKTAKSKHPTNRLLFPENGFKFTLCPITVDELPEVAGIYKKIFKTYPFPIQDPDFLANELKEGNAAYYCVKKDDQIVAVASAEFDHLGKNAEMTDFATLPEFRGHKLALYILNYMEEDIVKKHQIRTLYTIARAMSFPMNITFAKLNYHYGGSLIKNTNICGNIESMNVWYKTILPKKATLKINSF